MVCCQLQGEQESTGFEGCHSFLWCYLLALLVVAVCEALVEGVWTSAFLLESTDKALRYPQDKQALCCFMKIEDLANCCEDMGIL